MNVNARKRKGNPVDKPLCKYGSSCYRKNPEHWAKFLHSAQDETLKKSPERDIQTDCTSEVSSNLPAPKNAKEALLQLVNDIKGSEDSNDLPTKPNVTPSIVGQRRPFSELFSSVPKENQSSEEIVESEPDKNNDFLGNTVNKKSGETVKNILKLMPPDFFDFWDFCSVVNHAKPEDAFADIGLHLVGIYDLLSKKIPKTKTVHLHCHWRYYYDPPEFQTVIKLDGSDLFHIGYFRDEPSEQPTILASNSANLGAKLTLMGDNIFAAMNSTLTKVLSEIKNKKLKEKFLGIQIDLEKFAKKHKYSLEKETTKTKARQKKVNAKTFHSLGIVVPIRNGIGYRTLIETNASLKKILSQIVSPKNQKVKVENESILDDVIANVNYANDECDFGTGLELGIDLFCFGDPDLHAKVLFLLPLAYCLLKREKYGEIVHAHLKNRRKGDVLSDL